MIRANLDIPENTELSVEYRPKPSFNSADDIFDKVIFIKDNLHEN